MSYPGARTMRVFLSSWVRPGRVFSLLLLPCLAFGLALGIGEVFGTADADQKVWTRTAGVLARLEGVLGNRRGLSPALLSD